MASTEQQELREQRREQWRERVAGFRASGQNVSAWCAAQGIKPHQLRYWLLRLAPARPAESTSPQWLPVALREERGQEPPASRTGLAVRVGPCRGGSAARIRPHAADGCGAGADGAMLTGANPDQVYLACGSTDLRKSIKILQWDHNGFWLHYRRLERGRFQWPQAPHAGTLAIHRRQLRWLLDGLPLEQRQAHPEVTAQTVL